MIEIVSIVFIMFVVFYFFGVLVGRSQIKEGLDFWGRGKKEVDEK